ncbi:MAG TPA: lipocalin-like domain-containing protein [Candidatus Acidoferrales bacterium]|nr:lipocalin-like domain-containing protein [Candidatus Acidoferrales bacterium]
MSVSRRTALLGGAAFGAASVAAIATPSSSAVVGAWSLESFDIVERDGATRPRFGPNPVGYLIYSAFGRMSATLSGTHRPALEPSGEASSTCKDSLSDFLSYAGTYEIRGDRVFHHVQVSVFTNLVGTILERQFTIADDRLRIKTITPGMWGDNSILVWKRT